MRQVLEEAVSRRIARLIGFLDVDDRRRVPDEFLREHPSISSSRDLVPEPGPYQNIFPTLAVFEVSATVSRKLREGYSILPEFYLLNENSVLYELDSALIQKSIDLFARPVFDRLRGADLVFACIAYVERATLVTKDQDFDHVRDFIDVLDLKDSLTEPRYREQLAR